ncbi:hypothetical protein ACP0HM_29500 [Escherichia coli]
MSELGQGAHVEREIMLVKIQASGYGRDEVKRNTEIFRGQIIDVTNLALYRSISGHQR